MCISTLDTHTFPNDVKYIEVPIILNSLSTNHNLTYFIQNSYLLSTTIYLLIYHLFPFYEPPIIFRVQLLSEAFFLPKLVTMVS